MNKTDPGQLSIFNPRGWGGKRKGAGPKRKGPKKVSHRKRETFRPKQPIHVTLKFRKGLPSFRSKRYAKIVWLALTFACNKFDVRIVHFSIQKNHIHLILEAKQKESLSKAMQGFCIRIAKGVNKVFRSTGAVFADRYHAHILKSPAEARAALAYVICNTRRHALHNGHRYKDGWIDPLSSALAFDGWKTPVKLIITGGKDPPVLEAKSWLLTKGWRKHPKISPNEIPGAHMPFRKKRARAPLP